MHDCTSILDSNTKGTLLVPMIFRILDPYMHQHLFSRMIFALVPHIFCAQFLYSRGSRGKGSYYSGFLVLTLPTSINSLIYMQRYLAANICAVCRVEYRFSKKLNISIHKYTTHYQEMRSH